MRARSLEIFTKKNAVASSGQIECSMRPRRKRALTFECCGREKEFHGGKSWLCFKGPRKPLSLPPYCPLLSCLCLQPTVVIFFRVLFLLIVCVDRILRRTSFQDLGLNPSHCRTPGSAGGLPQQKASALIRDSSGDCALNYKAAQTSDKWVGE